MIIKKYWDKVNIKYERIWKKTKASQILSKKEVSLIRNYLSSNNPSSILDIGIGTGRILEVLLNYSNKNVNITGIDISSKMVDICNKKFKTKKKKLKVFKTDIESNTKTFKNTSYDFITAIRLIQYVTNWDLFIQKIYNLLKEEGIFIFSVPNKYSINYFFRSPIPIIKTHPTEIISLLKRKNFSILDIISYSKLPDILYFNKLASNRIYIQILLFCESILSAIFGKVLFGRVLFIVVKKK